MMLPVRNFNKLLLTALLVGAVSTASAGIPCGTNLEYTISGTTLVLTSPDPNQSATFSYVEAISGNTDIKSVTFPGNVTQIGTQAFNGCTALANVDLGSVQGISSYAFNGCTALQEIVIPPSVTNIGVHAFYGCSNLSNVLCRPQTAPDLGTDAFSSCASSLKICVSSLGEYRNKDVNWKSYFDALKLTECFLDEYDKQTIAEGKISTFREASVSDIDIFRTLQKAGSSFNTLCLPFNVEIEDSPLAGAEVYSFTEATISNGVLLLNIASASSISAGVPYLIRWPNTTGETLRLLHFTGITWDNDNTASSIGMGSVLFQGFYGKTHITGTEDSYTTLFLGSGNNLYYPNNESFMKGFRAYFKILPGPTSAPGMPAVLNIVESPNNATGWDAVETETNQPRKELRNGQIVIIRGGETFLVNGQKL